MIKFISTFTLCAFFSFDVFSGLKEDQYYPFASENALQRNAQAEVRKILDERDIEFTDSFKETLRTAVAEGELLGSVVWGHRSGGKAAQDLTDWVDKSLPQPEEVEVCGEIDLGDCGSVDKLIRKAKSRVEIVLSDLKKAYDEVKYGQKISDAIYDGSLPGSAIYKYKMTPHPDNAVLVDWVNKNLLNVEDGD